LQNSGSLKKSMKNPISCLYLENYLFVACKNKADLAFLSHLDNRRLNFACTRVNFKYFKGQFQGVSEGLPELPFLDELHYTILPHNMQHRNSSVIEAISWGVSLSRHRFDHLYKKQDVSQRGHKLQMHISRTELRLPPDLLQNRSDYNWKLE